MKKFECVTNVKELLLTFVNLIFYNINMNERIAEILKKENLSNSQFANLVGIQASAVTHIINGRNQPSLPVIQKILDTFRWINPEWLVVGIGEMCRKAPEVAENKVDTKPKQRMYPQQQSLFPEYPIPAQEYGKENELKEEQNVADTKPYNPSDPQLVPAYAEPQPQMQPQAVPTQNPVVTQQPSVQEPAPVQQQACIPPQYANQVPTNAPQPQYNANAGGMMPPYSAPMQEKKEKPEPNPVSPRTVKKIMVFYSDGTYEEYGAHLNL